MCKCTHWVETNTMTPVWDNLQISLYILPLKSNMATSVTQKYSKSALQILAKIGVSFGNWLLRRKRNTNDTAAFSKAIFIISFEAFGPLLVPSSAFTNFCNKQFLFNLGTIQRYSNLKQFKTIYKHTHIHKSVSHKHYQNQMLKIIS